jgi:hypothetical protein
MDNHPTARRTATALVVMVALASLGIAGFGDHILATVSRQQRALALGAAAALVIAARLGGRRTRHTTPPGTALAVREDA